MTLYKWSQTAASNATADSTIDWAEGMAPSAVNDSARAEMAAVAKYRDDSAGSLTTGGTATAYTLTSNEVFNSLANMSGQRLKVRFNATNGASPTLNVDGLGAKAIQTASGTAVPTGAILANSVHDLTYDNSIPAWLLSGAFSGAWSYSGAVTITGAATLSSTLALTGNLAINTDKFTVTAASGNTLVAGTLAVTGAATLSSTLAAGATTITGNMTASGAVSGATVAGAMVATQAQMETGTATDLLVAPGRQKNHPAHPKAHGTFNGGTGVLGTNHGLSSVTDNGTGSFITNFSTAFSGTSYTAIGSCGDVGGGGTGLFMTLPTEAPTTTACQLSTISTSMISADSGAACVIFLGDQ